MTKPLADQLNVLARRLRGRDVDKNTAAAIADHIAERVRALEAEIARLNAVIKECGGECAWITCQLDEDEEP